MIGAALKVHPVVNILTTIRVALDVSNLKCEFEQVGSFNDLIKLKLVVCVWYMVSRET